MTDRARPILFPSPEQQREEDEARAERVRRLGRGDEWEWRAPMQYVTVVADLGAEAGTRYFTSVNDLVVSIAFYPWEVKAERALRQLRAEAMLWREVKERRPIYYERARRLGWAP